MKTQNKKKSKTKQLVLKLIIGAVIGFSFGFGITKLVKFKDTETTTIEKSFQQN